MDSTSPVTPPLRQRREALARAIRRSNTAGVVLLALITIFTGLALLLAHRSQEHATDSEQQRARAEEQLWRASLAQARSLRLTREMSSRQQAMEAIRVAAGLRLAPELREEAITTLAMTDFDEPSHWIRLPTNVLSVAIDGKFENYASVDAQGRIEVRRVETDQPVQHFVTPHQLLQLAFSSEGRYLAISTTNSLVVQDLESGGQTLDVLAMTPVFHPNRPLLAVRTGLNRVTMFEVSKGVKIRDLPFSKVAGPLAFHPQSNWLAIGTSPNTLQVVDWESGAVVRTVKSQGTLFTGCWSADGRMLALGDDAPRIEMLDLVTGRLNKWPAHTREGVRLWMRPQGDLLASTAWDLTLRVWDPITGQELFKAVGCEPLGFSQNGRQFALWRPGKGLGLHSVQISPVHRLIKFPAGSSPSTEDPPSFTPDGRGLLLPTKSGLWYWAGSENNLFTRLATNTFSWLKCQGSNKVWAGGKGTLAQLQFRLETNAPSVSIQSHPLAASLPTHSFADVEVSGPRVLSRAEASLWIHPLADVASPLELKGAVEFRAPSFSSDGAWVASGTWSPEPSKWMDAQVWSARTGQLLTNLGGLKSCLTFSPDNRWLLMGTPAEYRLLTAGTWEPQRIWARNSSGGNAWAAFSADSQLLALHADDRTIGLVRPESGDWQARLAGPFSRHLRRLAFNADASLLAVGTEAHVELWHLGKLREELARLGWRGESSGPVASSPATRAFSFENRLAALIVIAALLALALAVALRRHQKRLVQSYGELDELIDLRNQQLALAQTELLHGQKMRALGTLAAGVAHDFNNLLSVVRMANQLTGEEARGNAEIQENVALVDKTVAQGKAVVRSMLGYSRKPGERGLFSPVELVEETVQLLHREFLSNIQLRVQLDRSVPAIFGTRNRLEQILLNLLVNAAEAMQGCGELTVKLSHRTEPETGLMRAAAAPDYVEISVQDNGPGISPEVQERMFEPFFTTKTMGNNRGTGLGLSMVYSIAQEEGYGIQVDSGPGRGTNIRIIVPVETGKTQPT